MVDSPASPEQKLSQESVKLGLVFFERCKQISSLHEVVLLCIFLELGVPAVDIGQNIRLLLQARHKRLDLGKFLIEINLGDVYLDGFSFFRKIKLVGGKPFSQIGLWRDEPDGVELLPEPGEAPQAD